MPTSSLSDVARLVFTRGYKMLPDIANNSSSHELAQPWRFSTSKLQDALPDFLLGWSTWQYLMTVLLGIVVYDQGTRKFRVGVLAFTNAASSHVHQTKRFYCRTYVQDSSHGPISPSTQSKVRKVSCTVGERASELCIHLSQVCALSIFPVQQVRTNTDTL